MIFSLAKKAHQKADAKLEIYYTGHSVKASGNWVLMGAKCD